MQKNQTTINLTRSAKEYLENEAASLSLTNSSIMESLLMVHAFDHGYVPSSDELDNFRKSFLVKGGSNVTGDFRNQIATFSSAGQIKVIYFFYKLNLIKHFRFTSNKMANFFKSDEICYFAIGLIGRSQQYVNDYLKSFTLTTATLGPATAPDNEFAFFSNHQQFKINKPYPLFSILLANLSLPQGTKVIKVHYTELNKIVDAIENI